ncbi:hypothetical protein M409DRAFT_70790 [Zasmidium cellare ATCC 36951]|uniref:SnoaL-like domain-containing protein n=1 Tax=Zasmidium cellare ATCC 36951 TaxID=1080233 RepID=A0A6A6BY36_ZASCE|nr:uncharacterized protein M409DRAFT_70790 [Zasmidium cellare ATCC 36951]KAF2159724.1 hypothetical protein M409DRAFT_70790 [Zasmidium cellare ATCC 36951]
MANTYNITAKETFPKSYCHLNATPEQVIDRFAVSELCRAWPVYRDASEWQNYRDAWADKESYLWTTWAGGVDIDSFIEISKKGRANGNMIMHRENGTLVDLNPETGRAVGKMKATITQRFMFPNNACDVECDCRFIFYCVKSSAGWKIKYCKLLYEKDKKILDKFPEGYKWLGAAQKIIGHDMLYDLPTINNEGFFELYEAMELWLDGKDDEVAGILHVPGH